MKIFVRIILTVLSVLSFQNAGAQESFDPDELFRSLQNTINLQRSQSGMSELPPPQISAPSKEETAPPPEKPEIDLDLLAKRVHEIVNRERIAMGLQALSWDDALASIALEHSEDMARNDYTAHFNLQGESPTDRGLRAGYHCSKKFGVYTEKGLSENICRNSLFHSASYINDEKRSSKTFHWNSMEELAESTVKSWMESEEHRMNMLDPHVDSEGIAVAIDENDKVYVTQLFC